MLAYLLRLFIIHLEDDVSNCLQIMTSAYLMDLAKSSTVDQTDLIQLSIPACRVMGFIRTIQTREESRH